MSIGDRLSFYKFVLTKDIARQAEFDYENFKTARDILHKYAGDITGRVVLDVGCGRLCGQALLFQGLGNRVTGIDLTCIIINKPGYGKYWLSFARNGLAGFARDTLYDLLGKNKAYYQRLRSLSGFKLEPKSLDIRQMNAENMLFPDNIFEIVISNDAFEHIADVPRAISEVYRVLKEKGIAYVRIHLFTSLSGGHHAEWTNTRKIPPWDHLRARVHTVPVFLNKLREHEYISLFREKFEILDVIDGRYYGKGLLTPSIRSELSDYSEEELLKTHTIIVGQKQVIR